MKSISINRINKGTKQITGELSVFDNDDIVFSCHTLELPDLNNANFISCIPYGKYIVTKRYSSHFGWHFHIMDVEGRDLILIHRGNYYTDIKGCVLVGSGLKDINHDGLKDVTNSDNTMKKLIKLMPAKFELNIV